MPIPLLLVDAFTDKPFSGNPAAVCLLENEQDADWMEAVAAEMNLAETAFVRVALNAERVILGGEAVTVLRGELV